ncbi:MAG TPA: hypothetical protein VLD37_00195 [Candidatus Bilamarchaeum sp.]|nr:hypothetical protein [Candidatus Bilamarchaeum sp.]
MNGHFGTREFLIIALLVVGLAAAFMLLWPKPEAQKSETAPVPPEQVPQAAQPSEPPPAPKAGPEPVPTAPAETFSMTSGEFVNESLQGAESRFYAKALSGEFDVHSFSWSRALFNETPDSIEEKPDDITVSYVRFNDKYIDGLRIFAFSVYTPKGETGPQSIFGSMLFISPSLIDGYAANGTKFNIRFDPHPEGSQEMDDCRILSSSSSTGASGAAIRVYDFECKVMYGASP